MDQTTLGLLILASLAIVVPASILLLSWLAGRVVLPWARGRKYETSHTDLTPYECGKKPFGSARQPFTVKFYLVAMLFIVFDIEAAFLYPWAVQLKRSTGSVSTTFVLVEMLVFVTILAAGYAYVWGRGALDWDR